MKKKKKIAPIEGSLAISQKYISYSDWPTKSVLQLESSNRQKSLILVKLINVYSH